MTVLILRTFESVVSCFQFSPVNGGSGLFVVELRIRKICIQSLVELPLKVRQAEKSCLLPGLGQRDKLPDSVLLGTLQSMLE